MKSFFSELSDKSKLTLWIFLLGLILLKPFKLERYGMLYPGDDRSNFAFTTSMVFGRYPHVDKEFVDEFRVPPLSRVGVGFMAVPLAGLYSMVDRIQNKAIVHTRTLESIAESWTVVGAIASSIIALVLSCFLLYDGLRFFYGYYAAYWAVVLSILVQGIPIYAFRRPVFSHIYELLFQCLGLYLFLFQLKHPEVLKKNWFRILIFIDVVFILHIRQNGLPFAVLWPLLIFALSFPATSLFKFKKQWYMAPALFFLGYGFFYLTKQIPNWYQPELYASPNAVFERADFLFEKNTLYFYLKRTYVILFGLDWGFIFTAPFLLVGAFFLFDKKFELKKPMILATSFLAVNFYILIIWRAQGSYYGYRYFIFAAAPILAVPLCHGIEKMKGKKWSMLLLKFWAFIPLLSMIAFESVPETDLGLSTSEFGTFHGNLTYQLQVWKTTLLSPKQFIFTLFKGGPLFWIYYCFESVGLGRFLSLRFHSVYPKYDFQLGLKILNLYLAIFTPLFMTKFLKKKN